MYLYLLVNNENMLNGNCNVLINFRLYIATLLYYFLVIIESLNLYPT